MSNGARRKGDARHRCPFQNLRMQNPKDLAVYRDSIELAVTVYRLTEHFPSSERFGLTSQMRRGSVSIGSNISEGCGRWGKRELVHYLQMAYAAANELAFQLTIATRLQFGQAFDRDDVSQRTDQIQRMLNRLMETKRTGQTRPESEPTIRDEG
jgi:four helix bundle protein